MKIQDYGYNLELSKSDQDTRKCQNWPLRLRVGALDAIVAEQTDEFFDSTTYRDDLIGCSTHVADN